MSQLNDQLHQVRHKRDDAMVDAASRGEEPIAAGIRAALEHGIPDLQRNLPRLREALGEIDAPSFALGVIVMTFVSQGLDIFQLVGLPQFDEIRRYMDRVKNL